MPPLLEEIPPSQLEGTNAGEEGEKSPSGDEPGSEEEYGPYAIFIDLIAYLK
jgi:hypothetical protein